jgi:hypothetical protein
MLSASQVAAIMLDFEQIARCGDILYMGFKFIYIFILVP